MREANRGCIMLTARPRPILPDLVNQIDGAEVWATSVLSGHSKNAEVDFTEASWSPTQLAEVDASSASLIGRELREVIQTNAA